MITFLQADSSNDDFRGLVSLLDKELAERDGDEHGFYAQFNKIENISNVVIAYSDGKPVGIGAFKIYGPGTAEIKRMFVLRGFRGNGVAFQILKQLEKSAAEAGFSQCILETGKRQPEAIALYQKAGYKTIPNYGQYEKVENSVCMSKEIRVDLE